MNRWNLNSNKTKHKVADQHKVGYSVPEACVEER